jgi:hypothetical protein
MLRPQALVRTDVSEELSAFICLTRIDELGTTLDVTSNRRTLRKNTKSRRFLQESQGVIAEDAILHNHRRENLHICHLYEILLEHAVIGCFKSIKWELACVGFTADLITFYFVTLLASSEENIHL